ncbi:MAG: ABC transporter permease [Acetobacterium sp.]
MYILKNSIRNVTRNAGRNILIGMIVLVIAISSCVALSIKQSAKQLEAAGLSNIEITGSISIDRQSLMAQAQEGSTDVQSLLQENSDLTLAEMQNYATSEYVKGFYYTLSSSVSKGTGLEPVSTSTTTTTTAPATATTDQSASGQPTSGKSAVEGGGKVDGPSGMGTQGDFTITGYSDENAMADFVSGTNQVSSGQVFSFDTADMTCLISEELATFNGLSVGSIIQVTNPNAATEVTSLTVAGIYSTTSAAADSGSLRFSTASDPANQIYTSYNTLNAICGQSLSVATVGTNTNGAQSTTALRTQENGIYTFSDLTAYENFKADVTAMGLPSAYTVSSTDVTNYENSLLPLQNLNNFATIFLVLVLLIGGSILVVLNILSMRERKYEIGVLTAIGMKKKNVVTQFIAEGFIVTLLAILLGTGIGAVASIPVANALLSQQIASIQTQETSQQSNFGRGGGSSTGTPGQPGQASVNYIQSISSATDFTVVMELIGIGILLTVLSSCGAMVFILRYDPLNILSNRS